MPAPASPVRGTGRGTHRRASTASPRALLGPLGSRGDWLRPDDPLQLGERQPANIGPTLPDAPVEPATEAGPVAPPRRMPAVRALVGLVDVAALGVAATALLAGARAVPLSAAEAVRAVRVVAAARPDVGTLTGGWPQRAFEAVAAAWVSGTDALHREPGAAEVVREPTVLAAAVLLVLAWVLASRLRLALPTRVAVLLGCAATPLGAALFAVARPGVLAAVPVLLAAVLVTGERAPWGRRIGVLLALAAAVTWVPALAVGLAASFAVLIGQGDVARRLPRPARRALVALLVLVAVALLAGARWLPGVLSGALSTGPAVPAPRPAALEWVGGGLLLVMAAVAVRRRWLRAPAVAVAALLATAILIPVARGDLLCVALPLLLLVGLAQGEELLVDAVRRVRARRVRTFGPRRRTRRSPVGGSVFGPEGWAAVAVAVVGVLVVAGVQVRRPVERLSTPPTAAVAAWFGAEVAGSPVIAADDALWPGLLAAGLPAGRLRSPGSAPDDFPGAAGWLVTSAPAGPQWVPYAAFADVRVLRRGSAAGQGAPADRTRDGVALAANPGLRPAAPARDALVAGRVDARLLAVLTTLAGGHTLDLADFPAATGSAASADESTESGVDPAPLRAVRVTAVDGNPVTEPAEYDLVAHWFDQQLGDYHPCAIQPDRDALLIRYCLPA